MKPAAPVTRTGSAEVIMWTPPSRLSRGASDADIGESARHHVGRLIDVAEVDHDGLAQNSSDAVEVESAKLIPLGKYHQGIRSLDAGIRIGLGRHLRQQLAGFRH